jgi:hypothetical protein
MVSGQSQVSQMREDKAKAATDSRGSARIERRAHTFARVMFNFFLFSLGALIKGQPET